jgi:serine/threonine-protein kinase HipA
MSPSATGTCYLAAEDSGIPVLTDLPTLLDIAERVESDTADYGELNRLLRAGSSLGGARPKAHVMDSGVVSPSPSSRVQPRTRGM